ncbi:MAG: transporter substrate-binding domain-containing protein [Eubacterium sp.]|nr:transporter substrate-binding domain-containing protein [Eubacterium sp.]
MKRFVAFLLAFLLGVMPFGEMAYATEVNNLENHEVVKVGWFEVTGCQEIDENGNPYGFSYDYLNEISRYTGLEFEYVEGKFSELIEELKTGEIDIMLAIEYSAERTEYFEYTSYPMCTSYTIVATLESKVDEYASLSSLNGSRIGMLKGVQTIKEAKEYLDENNITADIVEFDTLSQMDEALHNGEIDYTIENQMRKLEDDEVILCQIEECVENIAVSKKREGLVDILNSGMKSIIETESYYTEELFQEYFGGNYINKLLLTNEEMDAIEKMGSLKVFIDASNKIMFEDKNGKYAGNWVEIIDLISQKLGVEYEICYGDTRDEVINWKSDSGADFMIGFEYDYMWAREKNTVITLPFLTFQYHRIINKNTYEGNSSDRIAAVKNAYYTTHFLLKEYSEDQIDYYENAEECVKAVNSGKADMTFLDSFQSEYYLKDYRYNNLSVLVTDNKAMYCFAVNDDTDPAAVSAINKAIRSITTSEIEAIITESDFNYYKSGISLVGIIYTHPLVSTLLIAVIFALVVGLLILLLSIKSIHKQKVRAEKANAAKSEFLSRVTHDLRTPMNGILGLTQIAREENELSGKMKDYIDKMENSSNYLLGLINDVLDVSSIEAGTLKIIEKPTSVEKITSYIITLITPIAENANVKLVTRFTNIENINIVVDEMRVEQIYVNLISNAIKFSKPGSAVLWTVDCTKRADGYYDVLSVVEDHGCGMSKEFMERMFDPFSREEADAYEKEGTGLGLTIVKKLVEAMHGKLEVYSKVGEGTKFVFTVTRRPVEEDNSAKRTIDAESISFEGKKALVCEDSAINMEITVKMLESKGFEVIGAQNGAIGFELFKNHEPGFFDIIIMDIRMPVMDGLEATRKIRELGREDALKIPIIALSANAYEEDIKLSKEAGVNEHISKPVKWKEFFVKIYEYL